MTEDVMETERIEAEKIGCARNALKLEPGGVYAIEMDASHGTPWSRDRMTALRAALDREESRLGVKFLILGHGLTIAREAVDAA